MSRTAAERREAHRVEAGVVDEVDEELRRAGAGARHRVADHAAGVVLHDRVVRDAARDPAARDVRIAVDAALGHEPVDHAEHGDVGEEALAHQRVEAVGAVGRPVAVDLDVDVALGRHEAGDEDGGRALVALDGRDVLRGRRRRGVAAAAAPTGLGVGYPVLGRDGLGGRLARVLLDEVHLLEVGEGLPLLAAAGEQNEGDRESKAHGSSKGLRALYSNEGPGGARPATLGRVKTWIIRGVTLAGTLTFGYVLHYFLEPLGYAWVVWTLGGVALAFFALEMGLQRYRRASERAAWIRWRDALLDGGARRSALGELRRELARARRLGPRLRVKQARLSVVMAELQLAEGKSTDAIATLSKIDVGKLDPDQAAAIRLARAQAYLHLGDVDGAASTLSPLEGDTTGDAVLDASLELAFGALALEEGRVDDAAKAAAHVASIAEVHDELWDEAKALEAACLEERDEPYEEVLRANPRGARARAPAPRRFAAAARDPGGARRVIEGLSLHRRRAAAQPARAAVAIVLRPRGNDADVLFIRRPSRRGDRWSGDVAFPGGMARAGESAEATAAREAREEVGLGLEGCEGALADRMTARPGRALRPRLSFRAPGRIGTFVREAIRGEPIMRVRPVVFVDRSEAPLVLDPREVAEAFWVPLSRLRRLPLVPCVRRMAGLTLPFPCLDLDGRELWGLTLSMVLELRA